MIMTFEERLPVINELLAKRRAGWRLTSVSYEDVCQTIIFHFFKKYHTFDSSKECKDQNISEDEVFLRWANRVISNQTKNLLRQNFYKFSRPCIQGKGCYYNLGDYSCAYTASGKQCAECKKFAEWQGKKEDQYNIVQSLPIENHSQEVSNMQNDFIDVALNKRLIDIKIKEFLTEFEYKIYVMLYIENLEEEKVGALVGWKKATNSEIPGYQQMLKIKKKIIAAAREIIKEDI